MVNIFHGIFMVHKKNQVLTMKFINACFMAMKTKITSFSWLFHDFLIQKAEVMSKIKFHARALAIDTLKKSINSNSVILQRNVGR